MQILLQKKEQKYWLVSRDDRFLLVKIGANLNKDTEQMLLSGTCLEEDLKAKGLTWEAIPKKALRSVTFTGCAVGDRVTFAMKKGARSYALSCDCRMDDIEACFKGVELKKKRHSHQDFRENLQSKKGLDIAKRVSFILNLIAAAVFIGILLSNAGDKVWGAIGLAVSAVSLVVYCLFPWYFSGFDEESRRKFGYTAKAFCLTPAMIGPLLSMLLKNISAFHFEAWGMAVLITLVVTAIVIPLLFCFVRELRDTGTVWVAVALSVLFCAAGAVGQINHIFNAQTDEITEPYTVEETFADYGRHSTFYYCTVRPEIGHTMKLPINLVTYLRLKKGDSVTVYQGKGALGIAYAYVIPITIT